MNDRYEIEIGANISDFKKAMREIQLEIAEKKRLLAELQKENKYNSVGSLAFSTYTNEINDLKDEIKDAENVLEEMTDNTEKAGTSMSKAFKNATKTGGKFLLSLFSIRTMWALISKGANTYLQENEQLNQSVKLTSSLLGNSLAPIIQTVVDVAQYAMIVVSELIRLFTGYDAVAGTVTNANKNIAKSGKEASKSLAGFDTIQNLSSSSGAGISGLTSQTNALEEFQKKVAKIRDIFNEYEEPIKASTLALGVLVGASMLGKIANIIGKVGIGGTAGTGLAGIGSALAYIAGYSIIAIEIYYNVKIWKEIIDEGKEVVKTYSDVGKQSTYLTNKQMEINNQMEEAYKQGKITDEQYQEWNNTLSDSIHLTSTQGNNLRNNLSIFERITNANKSNTTALDNLNRSMYENALMIADNTEKLGLNGTELETNKAHMYNAIAAIQRNQEVMKTNSTEYKNASEEVKILTQRLNELGGEKYGADIEINTSQANDVFNYLHNKIQNFISEKHTAKLTIDADTSKAKTKIANMLTNTQISNILGINTSTIWGYLNSFDVGTNYVPNDQLAMVHKGEMIIPAKYNPVTSGINNNGEVVYKLDKLINVLENKQFDAYLDGDKITDRVISGINSKNRIMGGSVIK